MTRPYHYPRVRNLGRTLRYALLVVTTVLALSYVVELNIMSRRGFEVRTMEQRLKELRADEERLTLRLAEFESMDSLEAQIAALGLVPTDHVEYISLTAAPVARR